MASKTKFIVWLVAFCGFFNQIHGDDDNCGADIDLSLMNVRFVFTDDDVRVDWDLRTPTDCPLQYHVTVTDSELGVIRDDYLGEQSVILEAMSPCISYDVALRAVNKAIPTPEGPTMTTSIRFNPRAQIAPILKSLNVQKTSVNTTWLLEGDGNRCPLKNFYVDGGTLFNFSVPLENLSDRNEVEVEIESLLPNRLYYFQVYVENSGGLSPVTPIGVQTLP